MATYRKRGRKWLAEVRRRLRNGEVYYRAETFNFKHEAEAWARGVEADLDQGKRGASGNETLRDAFQRYAREVTPTHKGARWEGFRLENFERDPLADLKFRDLTPEEIAKWRDRRLKEVKPSTVNRELNLLSGVITTARREWKWTHESPMRDVRRPREPAHRTRRISDDEIDRICLALGYDGGKARTIQQETAVAFLFALETAMRQGEITGLLRADVFLEEQYVVLRDTKNRDTRSVALSKEAVRLLKLIPENDTPRLFRATAAVVSTLFRRARDAAKIEDLTFHDSRHEALTRLARKLDVLDLARMAGHRDPRSLMIYYNPTPTEIAKRLG